MNKEEAELYLKWMAQRESTQGTKFQELIESDKEEITVADLMELIIMDDKEIKRLRDFIQSVWNGLGEAGRNEHYELFKEYMAGDEQ